MHSILNIIASYTNMLDIYLKLCQNKDFAEFTNTIQEKGLREFIKEFIKKYVSSYIDDYIVPYVLHESNDKIFEDKTINNEQKVKVYIARAVTHAYTIHKQEIQLLLLQVGIVGFDINLEQFCKNIADDAYKYIDYKNISSGKELYIDFLEKLSKYGSDLLSEHIRKLSIETTSLKKIIIQSVNILKSINDINEYSSIIHNTDSDTSSDTSSDTNSDTDENDENDTNSDTNSDTNENDDIEHKKRKRDDEDNGDKDGPPKKK